MPDRGHDEEVRVRQRIRLAIEGLALSRHGLARSEMSAAPDRTLTDLQRTIDDLRRQLAERAAECDKALARETAMAEMLGVINLSSG
jgi:hypothetical protein